MENGSPDGQQAVRVIDLNAHCKARYPQIAAERVSSPSCGPGWNRILANVCRQVSSLLDQTKNGRLHIHYVKEKMGTLRFAAVSQNVPQRLKRRLEAAIDLAEEKSGHVCEQCGAAGTMRVDAGWYATRCDEHSEVASSAPAAGYERGAQRSRQTWIEEYVRYNPKTDRIEVIWRKHSKVRRRPQRTAKSAPLPSAFASLRIVHDPFTNGET